MRSNWVRLCVYGVWCECEMSEVKLVNQFEELCSFQRLCQEVSGCEVSGGVRSS